MSIIKKIFFGIILSILIIFSINCTRALNTFSQDIVKAAEKITSIFPEKSQILDINIKRALFCARLIDQIKFISNSNLLEKVNHATFYANKGYPGYPYILLSLSNNGKPNLKESYEYTVKIYETVYKIFFFQSFRHRAQGRPFVDPSKINLFI